MQSILEIKRLSREEKLKMMETIWDDLLTEEEMIESPDWHRDALKETERRLNAGKERIVDWKDAKKELRKQFD